MDGSIVCGVDGSDESRDALRVAAQLSGQLGVPLVVAHVTQAEAAAPAVGAHPVTPPPARREPQAGQVLLEQVAAEVGLYDADLRSLHGLPAERLAELADEETAAFVVVGSRGRGAFKAAFLGSVSRDLIGVASCPVLVVPPGAISAHG
ncbi:MAG TPA: universal stress protein [Gaiellaceae bacterium]|nr:universal stress protein [Gaiellaceae bacterium]